MAGTKTATKTESKTETRPQGVTGREKSAALARCLDALDMAEHRYRGIAEMALCMAEASGTAGDAAFSLLADAAYSAADECGAAIRGASIVTTKELYRVFE